MPRWSAERTVSCEGAVPASVPNCIVLEQFNSTSAAIAALEAGQIPCTGYCAVYSESKGCYYLMWPAELPSPLEMIARQMAPQTPRMAPQTPRQSTPKARQQNGASVAFPRQQSLPISQLPSSSRRGASQATTNFSGRYVDSFGVSRVVTQSGSTGECSAGWAFQVAGDTATIVVNGITGKFRDPNVSRTIDWSNGVTYVEEGASRSATPRVEYSSVSAPQASLVGLSTQRAPMLSSPQGKPAVFFDFDGTLTVTLYIERFDNYASCDHDRSQIIFSLSPEELIGNFGGVAQLTNLNSFLTLLKRNGVSMFIVSHGLTNTISYHLEQVGLKLSFDGIYGSDSPALRKYPSIHENKAMLIKEYMSQMGFDPARTFFIDDLPKNLTPAQGLCQTLPVRRVESARPCATYGIGEDQMTQIISSLGLAN
mmetsp:Transcript_109310/g.172250  ORF Transcript_109310/g.172250 Transcript_109310/m.172250 type:complete len:425 (-) Transcript_109310:186-1460(-)